jgi:protein-L-isoaspartate(D-aspartate) O-methyltransferase
MINPDHASLEDSYRHKGLRRQLVKELVGKGIANPHVLEAIGAVPRHVFIDPGLLQHAYQDKAFPIGVGQTISQPYTVARQTELLELPPGAKILEIGTGSGYQCAVLVHMGYKVYTIEYQPELARRCIRLLQRLNLAPSEAKQGDGSQGWPARAPFDGILVTAGAPGVPDALKSQLAPGGRLIIPVGDLKSQEMLRVTKHADGTFTEERFGGFRFVPLKGTQGWG